MVLNIVLIIIGFALLIKGADFLVDGASQVAKRFRISQVIIGMTIVAMGTSLPELLVSAKSSLSGFSDLSIGNVVGSNLVNLLLVLGLCAIIKRNGIPIEKSSRMFDIPFNLIITFFLLLLCNFGASTMGITRVEGSLLLALFIMYLLYMIIRARREAHGNIISKNDKQLPMKKALVYIIIGAIGLKFGADFVVDNAVAIAQILGLSEKIIGLTIVSIGTSLPELVSSIVAIRKGEDNIAIGNVIGSNIFNILLILGVASVIQPIQYNQSYNMDIMILFFSSLLLMLFPYFGMKNGMSKKEGAIYVTIYILYMCGLFIFR